MRAKLVLLSLLFVGTASLANADNVVWTLNSVNLVAGTMTGSFTYNADLGVYSNWSITVPNEPAYQLIGETLTPANSVITGGTGPNFLALFDPTTLDLGILAFNADLTDAGGIVSLLPGPNPPKTTAFGEFSFVQDDAFPGGTVTAVAAVPEPGYPAFVALLLSLLLIWRVRTSFSHRL